MLYPIVCVCAILPIQPWWGSTCVDQVGSYEGVLVVWESVLRVQPDALPVRTRKAIETLRSLVDGFPRTHQAAAEMDFLELVEKIRAKYRQVCSGLPSDVPKVRMFFVAHAPPMHITDTDHTCAGAVGTALRRWADGSQLLTGFRPCRQTDRMRRAAIPRLRTTPWRAAELVDNSLHFGRRFVSDLISCR